MLILHLTKSEKNKQNSIFPTSYPKKSIKCINFGSLAQSYHKSLKLLRYSKLFANSIQKKLHQIVAFQT